MGLPKVGLPILSEVCCLAASDPGFHHVDQERFPLSGAAPVRAKKGDVVIFSYLLVHGSYLNT